MSFDATKYRHWGHIPADQKTTGADGTRKVMVWDPKVGTVLVNWIGPEG
jgi:hypothetical protein